MSELLRIKDKYQVTLPANLRHLINVNLGDYLEASVQGDGLLLRPVHIKQNPKTRPSIVEYLREERPSRSREDIDADLANDRSAWS